MALKQKPGDGWVGGAQRGLQPPHTLRAAHTDFPERCNPGSSAACPYMSAPRCCHHTFSPKQHNYSALSDRVQGSCLANLREAFIRKKNHIRLYDPVTGTGIMRGNVYQDKKQQMFDAKSNRKDNRGEWKRSLRAPPELRLCGPEQTPLNDVC